MENINIYSIHLPTVHRVLQYLIRRHNGCTYSKLFSETCANKSTIPGAFTDTLAGDMEIILYDLIDHQFIDMVPKRESPLLVEPTATGIPELAKPVKPEHLRECYITARGIELAVAIKMFYGKMKSFGIDMDDAVIFQSDIEWVKQELDREVRRIKRHDRKRE